MSEALYTDLARAIRDRVNSLSDNSDRLKLQTVDENKTPIGDNDPVARMLFMDADAPVEYWSGIEGAYLVVYWRRSDTLDSVVSTIMNGGPEEAD